MTDIDRRAFEEAKEKSMEMFWAVVHIPLICILIFRSLFVEFSKVGKEFFGNEKISEDKNKFYPSEKIIMLIIIFCIIVLGYFFIVCAAKRNPTVAGWFCVIAGIVYVYIAVRQIVKVLLIPGNGPFLEADISNFTITYMGWWILTLVVSAVKARGCLFEQIIFPYKEEVKIGLLFVWYYFNILFAVGGLYIFLCCLVNFLKSRIINYFSAKKIKDTIDGICGFWKHEQKFDGVKSCRLWKENCDKKVLYKVFMTILLLIFDIVRIACLFAKYFFCSMILYVFKIFFDSIRVLYQCAKKIWNRYQNNEWMYLLAQIAGLCSYIIVFLIIQYGVYEERTVRIYEFVGTIILVPYFIDKIRGMNKKIEDEVEV